MILPIGRKATIYFSLGAPALSPLSSLIHEGIETPTTNTVVELHDGLYSLDLLSTELSVSGQIGLALVSPSASTIVSIYLSTELDALSNLVTALTSPTILSEGITSPIIASLRSFQNILLTELQTLRRLVNESKTNSLRRS